MCAGEGLTAEAGVANPGGEQGHQRHPPPSALILPDKNGGPPSPSLANPIYGMPPGQIESPAKV